VVYVFGQHFGTNNAWGQVKKLINPTPAVQDHFGSALALGDDKLIVGTQLADANGVDSGAAYVQAQNFGGVNNWGQVDRLLPATVGAADYFGCSVAVSHHTVVVGAYNGLDGTARPGTVFMFRLKFGNPPQVTAALADQTITGLTPLAYTIPANAFTDPDVEDTLTLSLDASLSPPGWLNFDATAGLFNGTPSSVGNYPAGVVATDYDGLTASNSFTIHVVSVPNVNSLLSLRAQMFGTEEVAIITLTGAANTKYKLQCCSSLIGTPVWVDVASSKSDGSGTIIFYDVTPPAPMFYRAVAQ
jgi:hypothetical protein